MGGFHLEYSDDAIMTLQQVLPDVRDGCRAARTSWDAEGLWISLMETTRRLKLARPFLIQREADGGYMPWFPTAEDRNATDWYVLS